MTKNKRNIKKKKEYKYCFSDSTNITKNYCIPGGLVHPQNARKYAIQFYNIVKELIKDNYVIVDCKIEFFDDEQYSYGEMILVKNKIYDESGIKNWENEYLTGNSRYRWERNHDMIDPMCFLHMNLEHINNRPFLTVDDNMVVNDKTGKHKGRNVDGKYHLEHHYVAKMGKCVEFIPVNKECWTTK